MKVLKDGVFRIFRPKREAIRKNWQTVLNKDVRTSLHLFYEAQLFDNHNIFMLPGRPRTDNSVLLNYLTLH